MEKNRSTASGQAKVKTRYERRMEARRLKEEKERKQERLFRGITAVICIVLVSMAAYFGITSVTRKKAALNDPYITVGTHTLTKLEYDYYYFSARNNYLATNGSFLDLMGIDTARDFSGDPYFGSETMTWGDFFAESAVAQIKQTKALCDDALANEFSYNSDEDYHSFITNMTSSAESGGMSLGRLFQNQFGPYATQANTEGFVRENLLSSFYYEHLLEKNQPTAQEIKDRYEEDAKLYDSVDYRNFTFTADLAEGATEQETASAMEEIKAKAEEMQARVDAGETFNSLCIEYAKEDMKASYEQSDTASLVEGASYYSVNSNYSDWLYEDGRKAGDTTVAEDAAANSYTVVVFEKRYYEDSKDAEIGDMIASERVQEYVAGLTENYEVSDIKGELKYLTATQEAAEETEANTDDTKAAASQDEQNAAGESAESQDNPEETQSE